MDYDELKEKWSPQTNIQVGKKKRWYWLLLIVIPLIIFVIYLFLSSKYIVTITNERNDTLFGNLTIKDERGNIAFQGYDHKFEITLWKGNYQGIISLTGYQNYELKISNPVSLKFNYDIIQTALMKPIYINLSSFVFIDPTQTLTLSPLFDINGTNILQDNVRTTLSYSSSLMYGFYNVKIYTDNFYSNGTIEGAKLLVNNESLSKTTLMPNEKFVILTSEENQYITKFLGDYLNYSSNNYFLADDTGFPKQFFLYNKSLSISLGDMIFLFCELKTYNISFATPVFFVPQNFSYQLTNQSYNFTSCYSSGLSSLLPILLNNQSISETLIANFLGRTDVSYSISNLNSKEKKIPIAFSFDIESGRYVRENNKGPNAISPCSNSIASIGLDDSELVCNDANYVAWFSPFTGTATLNQYPYPWVSGIEGFQEIMSYSENYGIPATYYIVVRDYKTFKDLNTSIPNQLTELVKENLTEIGAHTRYHTNLGSFNQSVSETEMKKSKEFFNNEFNISIVGFRPPYWSITDGGNCTEFIKAVQDSGYEYFSAPCSIDFSTNVKSKPNTYSMTYSDISSLKNLIQNSNYIISDAHPWNIFYVEYTQGNDVYLKEDLNRSVLARATILTAISNGAFPVKVSYIQT